MPKNYNEYDINSILEYANLLVGKTFFDVINERELSTHEKKELIDMFSNPSYKGGLGNLLECVYFGYNINSNQKPDFSKVGLELKSSPYELNKNGLLRAGERLSITMVPQDRPIETDFFKSDVWHKISKILLIYYLRDRSKQSRLEYRIDYSYLYQPPSNDLKIIMDDFDKIVGKIIAGRAHEISESDTLYLGACTKGSTAEKSTRPQFYGNHIPARKRNFCLKQPYMTYVLNNYIASSKELCESIIKENLENLSFEEYVLKLIDNFVGKSDKEICQVFNREYNNNKSQWIDLTYKMLGIKSNKAEEFIKANIVVKTIRINEKGTIKENMSFPAFKYKELIKEKWEESTIHNYFTETKFLFVIFKQKGDEYVLKGCQFWNMPYMVLENQVKKGWLKVVETIKKGIKFELKIDRNNKVSVTNNLLKKTENEVIHVRPHAQKSYHKLENGEIIGNGSESDANELPDGRWMTTYSFWVNNDFILSQIKDEFKC